MTELFRQVTDRRMIQDDVGWRRMVQSKLFTTQGRPQFTKKNVCKLGRLFIRPPQLWTMSLKECSKHSTKFGSAHEWLFLHASCILHIIICTFWYILQRNHEPWLYTFNLGPPAAFKNHYLEVLLFKTARVQFHQRWRNPWSRLKFSHMFLSIRLFLWYLRVF